MSKIIIIGGGAAGMMAAGVAAKSCEEVLLIEKTGSLGNKLSITGKGKCNLTNTEPKISTFIEKFGVKGKFLYNCFYKFFNQDLIEFFESKNLPLKEFSGGRIYPASLNARDVVKTLIEFIKNNGVQVKLDERAVKLIISDDKIKYLITNEKKYSCDSIIIAAGGMSYPKTGSTGDGYELAKQAGHTISPLLPSLVPLKTENIPKNLVGLKLKNVKVDVYNKEKEKLASEFGEFSFTDYGLDGSAILELSRNLKNKFTKCNLELKIDLKPVLTEKKLHNRIIREAKKHGKQEYKTLLGKLLPKKMVTIFLRKTNVDPHKKIASITTEDRSELIDLLKNFTVEICRTASIENAIITAGGIKTDQINPRTMESKLVQGLFFAGEVVDIDAATGGYNLQAAFSTGYVAGKSAAGSSSNK